MKLGKASVLNSMNNFDHRKPLLTRNEGKIKSYDSCYDVRAWSHDGCVRDRYLRQWMRCDMPFCVIPISTLAGILKTMTCGNRGKATPRCRPDCKSKLILESICNSCHAMKECLRDEEQCGKYFIEEDLDTSHWPCERCLEALKSVKMFWKIIAEKIFNVNISKSEDSAELDRYRNDSIREVARIWQKDMVQQALFVKAQASHKCSKCMETRSKCACKPINCSKPFTSHGRISKKASEGDGNTVLNRKNSKPMLESCKCSKNRVTISDRVSSTNINKVDRTPRKKLCRCTSVRVKTLDVGCATCHLEQENEELKAYRINLEFLQCNYNKNKEEVEKLTKENVSLKKDLKNAHKSYKWKSALYCPTPVSTKTDAILLVPKPLECSMKEHSCDETDSEMIITMKNCKNENFGHISLLQVLHKTNDPLLKESEFEESDFKREDPMNLLTKVQHTLGAMVSRERSVATGRRHQDKQSSIDASYQRCTTAPSCSTLSAHMATSESNFASTKGE